MRYTQILKISLFVFTLCGCVSSIVSKEKYIAYEADINKNFNELSECIIENSRQSNWRKRPTLSGKMISPNLYKIFPNRVRTIQSGVDITILDDLTSRVAVYSRYNRLHNLFPEGNALLQNVKSCIIDNIISEKRYYNPEKVYEGHKITKATREKILNALDAYKEKSPTALEDDLLKSLHSRDKVPEFLMIEKAISGELKPLTTYYTDRVFSYELSQHSIIKGSGMGMFFAHTSSPFRKEIDFKNYTLCCSLYGKSRGLFKSKEPTGEYIVTLWHNDIAVDAAIVNEDHNFVKACKKGKFISSK
jgi:hypothetical protein